MIPTTTRILVATEPADMRRSIDGLASCVREVLQEDPRSEGALFVFANRRSDRVKILWRDATGWCLLYKRLDVRKVVLPANEAKGARSVTVDARTLAKLLDGVEGVRRRPTKREIVREAREKVHLGAPMSTRKR